MGTRLLLIVLAFGTGMADAFAFLALGGIFTANMTGNLVFIGLPAKPDYSSALVGGTVAVLVFAAASYAAFRFLALAQDNGRFRAVVLRLLTSIVVAEVLVIIVWLFTSEKPNTGLILLAIGFSAIAMAVQTSTTKHFSQAEGITTTYSTGTITFLMQNLAERKFAGTGVHVGVIVAIPVGALLETALYVYAKPIAPVGPAVLAIVALVIAATTPGAIVSPAEVVPAKIESTKIESTKIDSAQRPSQPQPPRRKDEK